MCDILDFISTSCHVTVCLLEAIGNIDTGIHIYIIYPYIYIAASYLHLHCSLHPLFRWSFLPPRPDGRIEVELVLEGVPGEGGAEIE